MNEDCTLRGGMVPLQSSIDMDDLILRPIRPQDDDFLHALYAETRPDLEVLAGLSDRQKEIMVRQQFEFQHRDYKSNYPEADFEIILFDNRPIGRLYVERGNELIRLIEVTVGMEFRGLGIGTLLLRRLGAEAASFNMPIRLHVAWFNPAVNLYLRHGFQVIADSGVFLQMEWSSGC